MFVDNTNCTTSHKPDCLYILSTDHFQDSADDEVNGADGLICEIFHVGQLHENSNDPQSCQNWGYGVYVGMGSCLG